MLVSMLTVNLCSKYAYHLHKVYFHIRRFQHHNIRLYIRLHNYNYIRDRFLQYIHHHWNIVHLLRRAQELIWTQLPVVNGKVNTNLLHIQLHQCHNYSLRIPTGMHICNYCLYRSNFHHSGMDWKDIHSSFLHSLRLKCNFVLKMPIF